MDTFIMLHPRPEYESVTDLRLQRLAGQGAGNELEMRNLCAHPLRMHLLFLTSVVGNWRWYCRSLIPNYTHWVSKKLDVLQQILTCSQE